MAHYTIILNPQADSGRVGSHRETLREHITRVAEDGNHQLDWQYTKAPRHAIDLARQAAENGTDVIVCVGGDGTVHEIVNGLLTAETDQVPQLGIVPVGSGNDFASNIDLPLKTDQAIHRVFHGQPMPCDAASITDNNGRTEYWNNSVGVGFTGIVNRLSRESKLSGLPKYLLAVFKAIVGLEPGLHTTFTTEDGTFVESIQKISICNGIAEGGGFPVAPHALVDDGKVSYTIMRECGRLHVLFFLVVVLASSQHRFPKWFVQDTVRSIRAEADRAMEIHTDGEIFALASDHITMVQIETLPAALQVIQ